MAEQPNGEIRYTTKEILANIFKELAESREDMRHRFHDLKSSIAGIDKRLTYVEQKVAEHQRIADDNLPAFNKLIRDFDVRREVEAALEASDNLGFSRRQKIAGTLTALAVLGLNVYQIVH